MELLKYLYFDCKLNRFAEVFGDLIDFEDVDQFRQISPLESADLEKARAEIAHYYNYGSPEFEFEVLGVATVSKLNKARQKIGLEPQDLQLLIAFFEFVNDAYTWEDLADLERWEEALFNSLNGYYQKNYKPLTLEESTDCRDRLFSKFIYYIVKNKGYEVANKCINTIWGDIPKDFKMSPLFKRLIASIFEFNFVEEALL